MSDENKTVDMEPTMMDPMFDMMALQKVEQGMTTPSGVIVPEATQAVVHGLVLAIGPGLPQPTGIMIPTTVAIGDVVAFTPSQALEFWDTNHRRHYFLRQASVLSKVRTRNVTKA